MTVWDKLNASGSMTEAEYLALGENNHRQELFDGQLRVTFNDAAHSEIGFLLRQALAPAATNAGLRALTALNLRLAPTRYLIPDGAVGTFGRTTWINPASDALLVTEITSPGTALTDRGTKKQYYAEAGIAWYLLAEPDFAGYESVTLRLFRLDGDHYTEHAAAGPGETLVADIPFRIEISTDDLINFT
jgi:Uma2 family endonuclease